MSSCLALPIVTADGVATMVFTRMGLGWGVWRPMGIVSRWARCCKVLYPIVRRLAMFFKRLGPGNVKGMNMLNDSLSQIHYVAPRLLKRPCMLMCIPIRVRWFKGEQPSEISRICTYLFSSLGYVIKY